MLQALARYFVHAGSSCRSQQYSTASALPRRNWGVSSHPAPRALVENEEKLDLSEDVDLDRDNKPPTVRRKPTKIPTPHEFRAHRQSLKDAFPDGWSPPRKLSREAMDGLRAMHMFDKSMFSTPVLAEKFKISPEAVRRILKSRWEPTRDQRIRYAERERRTREEKIRANRLEERMRHLEIRSERPRDDGPRNQFRSKTQHTRGIDHKDRLTFE